jgi:YgiT-type zinc finger domain-containing protein
VNQCPVCRMGELRREHVETWMRRGDRWVLFTRVPAMRCDTCGETTFSQEVAGRLGNILAANSPDRPTGSRTVPEYDLDELDRLRSAENLSSGSQRSRSLA